MSRIPTAPATTPISTPHLILNIQNEFAFEEYYIKYWKIDEKTTADVLAGNIRWIVSEYKLDNRDVVVLGRSVMLLREIEDARITKYIEKNLFKQNELIECIEEILDYYVFLNKKYGMQSKNMAEVSEMCGNV